MSLHPFVHRLATLAAPIIFVFTIPSCAIGQENSVPHLVSLGANGKLIYHPYTPQGDVIPDFSNCGYGGGGVAIPTVPVKITLQPQAQGDDLARLQAAINQLARQPVASNGFRGALFLRRGVYRVSDSLKINASGIVIRGEGADPKGTVLLGTGRKQYPLLLVQGQNPTPIKATQQDITSSYVPVGNRSFEVADGSKFKAGDTVFVTRHGNAEWIHEIKMDQITPRHADHPEGTKQWQAFDLNFDRTVTSVAGNHITVDAPITCAIDARWGGGSLTKYSDAGRIDHVGVENLFGDCEFDRTKTSGSVNEKASPGTKPYFSDEDHANYLINFNSTKNAWGRNLSARYLEGITTLGQGCKWITIQDCSSVEPVSVLTGGRRYTYHINGGQLCLVQRCYAKDARHSFIVGARVSGPNVFLDCQAESQHATSEPHHRWSVGGLYDNVHGEIAIQDRQWMGSGHGWSGANYVAWNCEGSLVVQNPPTAKNFAIGFVGKRSKSAFPGPEGWWESFGQHVEPRSLYVSQLQARLGTKAVQNIAKG